MIDFDQVVDCAPLLASGILCSDPDEANARLAVSEGKKPWRNGMNVPAINELRRILSGCCPAEFVPAFVVIAPHSHWSAGVLIERFDPKLNRYWLGPRPASGKYRPYSFAFSDDGFIPFEYADESVPMDEQRYRQAIAVIGEIETAVRSQGRLQSFRGLGLSIDHRFKTIGERTLFSTMEHQCHETRQAYVEIDEEVGFRSKVGIGQVGWSAWAHDRESERDIVELMRAIEEIVESLPPDEAREFIKSLD